jgi:hypothetical protein
MEALPISTQPTPPTQPATMNYGGVLPAMSLAGIEQQRAAATAAQARPVIIGLSQHIRNCWVMARDAKVAMVEKRMLDAVRARRGQYEESKLQQIREQGGSEIWANLTSVKCRAAASWVRDVLMGQGSERPWAIHPTKVPDIPPDQVEALIQQAAQPIAQQMMAGQPMPDEAIKQMMSEMYDQLHLEIRSEASAKADRMADLMEDQLVEGKWLEALDAFIDDITTFPAAIVKGPVVRKKPCLAWVQGPNGTYVPEVKEDLRLEWERVDPFRFYPAPNATTVDDGYMIEHHRMSRLDLQEMIGVEGYDENSIKTVLDEYGRGGLREWMTDDAAKAAAEGKSTTHLWNSPDGLIDALQYWGSVPGKWLVEWGLTKEEVPDESKEYVVEAWLVGSYVIKATLNSDPLMRKPYYKASYEEIPGAFWGNSVADLVKDSQTVVNAAARQLVNNMGISSGPQVGVNIERLAVGEKVTQMYPWKIWQFQNDPMGSSAAPISFFSPESRIPELMSVFEKFSQLADEYSGIPRYMAGESPGGVGRTASGLSMLINNASKSIKQVIANIDNNVFTPMLDRLYYYNMKYSEEAALKGDVHIVARGASGILAKEAAQVRRNEFLAATGNAIDMQIVGIEGRAAVLREVAKGLDMEVDRIVPPVEVMKAKMAAQAMAMQQAQAQQAQQPQEGPSASGQNLQNGAPVTDNFSPQKNV